MQEIKAAGTIVVAFVVILFFVLMASAPDKKTIAENCHDQFGHDAEAELRCKVMANGTRALDLADRRDGDRDAAIADIVNQSR